MKKAILILSCVLLAACTDPQGAREDVKNMGLEHIKTGGYAFFACSNGDLWATKFTAKRQDGTIVKGVVCDGILKGSTVRFR